MRHYLALLFAFIIAAKAGAQFAENHAVYVSTGFTFGDYWGMNMTASYMYKQTFSLNFENISTSNKAASLPADYYGGLEGFMKPRDRISTTYGAIGFVKRLGTGGLARLNAKIGIGLTTFSSPTNWESRYGGLLGCNYTYDTAYSKTASLVISPTLELPLARGIGMSFAPYAIINPTQSSVGVSVNLMFGLLRGEKIKSEE